MGLMMRPSNPAMVAVGRSIAHNRDLLLQQWVRWIGNRMAEAPQVNRPTVERQLALLVDVMIELAGPLRRQVAEIWYTSYDFYGRTAAARGLAAGEVVEEIQYLRELLIRQLSETVAAMPARQAMAAVLRLNRLIDKGIAHAVVGYTDALVESLLNRQGIPIAADEPEEEEMIKRVEQLEDELAKIRVKNR